MGEILRAVLEDSGQFSRVKFYGARLYLPGTTQQGLPRSTVTTFDKFGYFLLTSFYLGGMSGGTPGINGAGLDGFANNIQLQDLQTGKLFYSSSPERGGPPGVAVASWGSSPTELPQYVLFEPGERIRLIYTWNILQGGAGPDFVDVMYSGIEYLMKGGPKDGRPSS